ncbi:50S ribosomal protein L4 [Rhodoflexus caldus]|uniref:50S ribosomal protein L4 n=1 Tax=Rhodoflexus caldus TaxID=2891236 RepID=UPI00202A97DB|nr:50S ribosomal protein L4 [Rhodoflexus caldus]
MELSVKNIQGGDTGRKVTLADSVFGIEPNNHAIYLDVKQYLANRRQGTHKAKERNEVSGSTKKIVKQKGSGGARHGSRKAPIFVGGGRIFGPRVRDYSFKLNKKLKQLARRSALTYKAQGNAIHVLENPVFAAPKTKEYIKVMNALSLADKKTLVVLPEPNENFYLSSRNLQNTKVVQASSLNTYDVMNCDQLVLCEGAVAMINESLGK